MVIWQGAFADAELETDLAVGTSGGAAEVEGSDTRGIRIRLEGEVLEGETEDTD